MDNELNQVPTIDDDLFSDIVDENETFEDNDGIFDDVEDTPVEDQVNEEVPEASEAPFMEITYNKEKKGLSREEAIAYAQKGMNYDHMVDKYNRINAPLEELARMNNMNVDDFINHLGQTQMQFEVSNVFNQLKQQYPNSDDVLLQQLAQSQVNNRLTAQAQQMQNQRNEQMNAQKQKAMRDVEMFKREFPDVDYSNLPQEVYEDIKNGHTLLSAYYKYQNSQNSEQIKQLQATAETNKQNEANKRKSFGQTTNAGGGEIDPFLEGLFSE